MGRTATSGYRASATKLIAFFFIIIFIFCNWNKQSCAGRYQPTEFLLIILLSAGAAMTAGWRRLSVAALHLIHRVVSDSNKYHWADTQTHRV